MTATRGQTIQVKTHITIAKPAHEVFEAIVDPQKMANYFISSGSGRLEVGSHILWDFIDIEKTLHLDITAIDPGKKIAFDWQPTGVTTQVQIDLQQAGQNKTLVTVSDSSWPPTGTGIRSSLGQMEGWTHFLCCLLAFMEYGVKERKMFVARI